MRNPHPNSDYRVMENPVIGIGPEKSPSRWQSRRLAGFRRGMGVFHSESIVSRSGGIPRPPPRRVPRTPFERTRAGSNRNTTILFRLDLKTEPANDSFYLPLLSNSTIPAMKAAVPQ